MTCAPAELHTLPKHTAASRGHSSAAVASGYSWHDLLVVLAIVVGATVRLLDLDRNALWIDEFLSVRSSSLPAPQIVFLPDGYPPLYDLILHVIIWFGGGSDWWVRLPSALAGIASIPLLYLIGRRMDDRLTGALAACLLALHPLAIWYSQEARAYSMATLCVLASTLCLLSLLRDDRRHAGVLYACCTGVGFGLHYYYAFPFAAQALVAAYDFVRTPERRRLWIRTALMTLPAIAIWLPGLVMDFSYQAYNDRSVTFSWLALPYTLFGFVGGFSLGPSMRDLHPSIRLGSSIADAIVPHLAVILAAFLSLGTLTLIAFGRRLDRQRVVVLLMAGVPLIGTWIASTMGVGYRPRYALPALPFALLWIAGATRTSMRKPAFVLVAILCALELVSVTQMNTPPYAREDNRGAAQYVAAHSYDSLIVLVGEGTIPFERYLDDGSRTFPLGAEQIHGGLETVLAPELLNARAVFLVLSRPWTVDPNNRVQNFIDAQLPLAEERAFTGVTVRWYSRSAAAGNVHAESIDHGETDGRRACVLRSSCDMVARSDCQTL